MSDKKIRAIFYLTPFKWKYLLSWKKIKKYMVNWAISARTMSKYSHCEIWIPDASDRVYSPPAFTEHYTEMGGLPTEIIIFGTCYTSTMRGDYNGTVKRPASEVLDHPEHWEYIEVELTKDYGPSMMMAYMNCEVNNNEGYALWDLLKFLSPIHFPDKDRNICSEFCNQALFRAGVFEYGGIISPKKLHKKLTALGFETKKLT